ncbi:hypothetical protein TNCV_3278641 [Trichonephila clavipes]|nr:hypothetical protein TNCV_3278641 [Trichonephila clavipes]
MKTSSVESNSRSPNLSPTESKHRRFAMPDESSSPGSGNGGKRDRFEQTSRTLERKISMVSTKDQLIKKRFSSGLDEKEKGIRTAADSVQSGWPVVASRKSNRSRENHAIFARRRS